MKCRKQLVQIGSSLEVFYGTPEQAFKKLFREYDIQIVFTNHDYEPYAIERDGLIKILLAQKNIGFKSYKDQVIFEKDEVLKEDGKPYTVYTPYSKKWKDSLTGFYIKAYPVKKYVQIFLNSLPLKFHH